MLQSSVVVARAVAADLDGILELQAANQVAKGGMLSASLADSRVAAMIEEMPCIVSRSAERVTGFLMVTSKMMNADLPIVQAMFSAYQGTPDAYVYGPICVSEQQRGKGLAQLMFAELKRLLPGREGVLFIRVDNHVSLKAHARMGMREVANFYFNGSQFTVLSYLDVAQPAA